MEEGDEGAVDGRRVEEVEKEVVELVVVEELMFAAAVEVLVCACAGLMIKIRDKQHLAAGAANGRGRRCNSSSVFEPRVSKGVTTPARAVLYSASTPHIITTHPTPSQHTRLHTTAYT